MDPGFILRIFTMFLPLLLTFGRTLGCTRDELEMVQIITQHGSYAPHFVYPEDPNPETVWKEGLSDLTMLGKFQSYALGIFLRNFYDDFITSDPNELEVISASDKCAVKSTQSLVTALYTPTPYWEVVQNFSWQPIYIKYSDKDDKVLACNFECPAAKADLMRIVIRESEALMQSYQSLLLYWSMNSGMELKNILDVEKLFEVFRIEMSHNLTLPDWSKLYWDEMKYLSDVAWSLKAKSKKSERLFGGPLVHQTIEAMKAKAIHGENPKKVILYTAHRRPLFHFLEAMDIGKAEYILPCFTVLVELYKHEEQHFVRYLYLNSTTPEKEPQAVYLLTVPGCSEFCPLNYIVEYTKNRIPKNWDQECLFI